MQIRFLFLVVITAASLVVALAITTACAEPAEPEQLSNVPFASILELPTVVAGEKITYGTAPQNFMLHWRATGTPMSTLVFIHGGCWSNQFDLTHASAFASHVAQRGYEVWSLEYRRSGDAGGGWPGSLSDIEAAIKHIAAKNTQQPLILAGHSAGGHLALLAGARHADRIDAVIGLAAIAQLGRYAQGDNSCQQMVTQFMGGGPQQQADAYTLADPALQPLHASTVLLAGTADQIVPVAQADIAAVTTTVVQGAGHFDWLHPQTQAFGVFMETLGALVDDH